MIGWLIGDLWPYLAAAAGAVAAIAMAWFSGKRAGKDAIKSEALERDAEKQAKGREAVRRLRGADRNQSARQLRDNDDKWR